ncbi:MAG: hypothetical protein JXB00_12400 [Bacteroidales bacterium]|nr:hypothetical protein [Bacteroidales bacterium]
MNLKYIIVIISSLYFSFSGSAQNSNEYNIVKTHLNNILDSSLATGFYRVLKTKYIETCEMTPQIEYKQEISTKIIVLRYFFFKKKKEVVYVKSTPMVKWSYEKPFEKEFIENSDLYAVFSPMPVLLKNNIELIEIISNSDSSYNINLQIDEFGMRNLHAIHNMNNKDNIGLIINDDLIRLFGISSIKNINGKAWINLKFTEYQYDTIEYIKNELETKY